MHVSLDHDHNSEARRAVVQPHVSVVIPAYNAAQTLGQTLDALLAQTYPRWEAIVVDDGSSDATAELAARFAAADSRVRVLRQANQGPPGARNAGLALASAPWLLCLDADDWLAPTFLARLTGALEANPALDAVHCAWVRVSPAGEISGPFYGPPDEDLFPALTSSCTLDTPGVCLVRRSLVEAVGGFDPRRRHADDWDLWLRLARAGARFGAVREPLFFYRLQPASSSLASQNTLRLLGHILDIVTLAHSPDPRVTRPLPAYADGAPREYLAGRRIEAACWVAGLLIGQGADVGPLLVALAADKAPELDPAFVAGRLYEGAPLPSGQLTTAWPALWPRLEPSLKSFLQALEAQIDVPALARRTLRALENLVAQQVGGGQPARIGQTYVVTVELVRPLAPVTVPPGCEQLWCLIELAGERLGSLILPAWGKAVPADVIADAASAYAWEILRRFFGRQLYPSLRVERDDAGVSLWRGSCRLGGGLPDEVADRPELAHDQIGWHLFLQEIWGYPERHGDDFYDHTATDLAGTPLQLGDSAFTLEVSAPLPEVSVSTSPLRVYLTVGGALLGEVLVTAQDHLLRPATLMAALTVAAGAELCRVAVREALIGRPLNVAPNTLRARLVEAAAVRKKTPSVASGEQLVLMNRLAQPIGSSASRVAALPGACAPDLMESAQANHEECVVFPAPGAAEQVLYDPRRLASPRADRSLAGMVRRAVSGAARVVMGPRASAVPLRPAVSPDATLWPVSPTCPSDQLVILRYTGLVPADSAAQSDLVSLEAFAEQLRYLREAGFASIEPAQWRRAALVRRTLPARPVLITYDRADHTLVARVWPLLREHGFRALFVLALGRSTADQMDWASLRAVAAEGARFGAMSDVPVALSGLSPAEIVRSVAGARAALARGLGAPADVFAYTHGDPDAPVAHLVGACGFVFGLSCRPGRAGFDTPLLALPRVTVGGGLALDAFATAIDVPRVPPVAPTDQQNTPDITA